MSKVIEETADKVDKSPDKGAESTSQALFEASGLDDRQKGKSDSQEQRSKEGSKCSSDGQGQLEVPSPYSNPQRLNTDNVKPNVRDDLQNKTADDKTGAPRPNHSKADKPLEAKPVDGFMEPTVKWVEKKGALPNMQKLTPADLQKLFPKK